MHVVFAVCPNIGCPRRHGKWLQWSPGWLKQQWHLDITNLVLHLVSLARYKFWNWFKKCLRLQFTFVRFIAASHKLLTVLATVAELSENRPCFNAIAGLKLGSCYGGSNRRIQNRYQWSVLAYNHDNGPAYANVGPMQLIAWIRISCLTKGAFPIGLASTRTIEYRSPGAIKIIHSTVFTATIFKVQWKCLIWKNYMRKP
jgi:hypothetical protein